VSLQSLSDKQILSRTHELVRRERTLTLCVLVHLNEIERRRLHLKLGYASMFSYCTSGLGYSESAANLRIRTARCLARFPEIYGLLDANEVNPSTISQVAKFLTPENRNDILSRIRKKSQRQVETIIAEYAPCEALPRDRVRTVVVRVPANTPVVAIPAPASGSDWQENHRCNSGNDAETAPAGVAKELVPAEAASRTGRATGVAFRKEFTFTASEVFKTKFDQVKNLAAHRLPPNPSYEQVFELAMDCFLEKEDPIARRERREKRGERARAADSQATADSVVVNQATGTKPDRGARYISAAVRDQVFVRDRGRCTYTGPNGNCCASTRWLQMDHIRPVARGGGNTADNLRVLCAYHNRLEAGRLMGPFGPRRTREGPH
jgi:hypothetical protein